MIRVFIKEGRTLIFLRECRYYVRVIESPLGMLIEINYNGTVDQFYRFLKRYNKR